MPLIRIEYDNKIVESEAVAALADATQKIVSEVTNIDDVFVYANSSEIKVKVAPIEVFVEMSAHKIKDVDTLTKELTTRISDWK